MAISNLTLDCTNYEYNRLSFDYAGSGVTAEIEVDYGSKLAILSSFTLQGTNNIVDDTDVQFLCNFTADYTITIYSSTNTVLETQAIQCTNSCTPPSPPIDFDVDCNTASSTGFDFTVTEFDQSSVQAIYTQLRIYRSTADPSTLTLPDPAYTLILTLPSSTTEFTDDTADANTEYWYEAEYYNTLSGEVSLLPETEGPCTTLASTCSEAYPLSEFDFNTSLSDCNQLIISDLFNDDITFKIPSKYNCFDIASISTIYVDITSVGRSTATASFQIGSFSEYYDAFDQTINVELPEGVYDVKLIVTYLTNAGKSKTINQTQCVFICGTMICRIANLIAADITNSELAEYYDAIEVLANCNKCSSAQNVYSYLYNYDPDCDC